MGAIINAKLIGHLTPDVLQQELDRLALALEDRDDRPAVLLDCSAMTGYELAAREAFVAWNAAHRDRIRGLAILVEKPLWFALIATMSMVSRQRMKAFRTREDATNWMGAL